MKKIFRNKFVFITLLVLYAPFYYLGYVFVSYLKSTKCRFANPDGQYVFSEKRIKILLERGGYGL